MGVRKKVKDGNLSRRDGQIQARVKNLIVFLSLLRTVRAAISGQKDVMNRGISLPDVHSSTLTVRMCSYCPLRTNLGPGDKAHGIFYFPSSME
jgi:hypothetical protein